ncbi:hypothetical protein PBS_26220 [Paraburkholderia sp. 2C]
MRSAPLLWFRYVPLLLWSAPLLLFGYGPLPRRARIVAARTVPPGIVATRCFTTGFAGAPASALASCVRQLPGPSLRRGFHVIGGRTFGYIRHGGAL